MKVFVTGGNGFIGSRVVTRLVEEGHEVCLLLRETSRTDRLEGVPFGRFIGDVRDRDSLTTGMAGCDGVIHLASLSSWESMRSPLMREIVVDGTRNVLEAARANGEASGEASGAPRVVFVSSCTAIDGRQEPEVMTEETPFTLPPEPFVYANAKHDAEGICREFVADHGVPVTIVNPCEVYGPNDHDFITASYLRDTLKDWPAFSTVGGTAVAHVDDIASGIVAALEKGRPGERYILGGDNLSVREIVALTLEMGGKANKTVVPLPTSFTLWLVNALARVGLPTPVHPDLLAHGVLYWFVDDTKARRELGYAPRGARETVGDVVNWLKAAGHV
jgi:dihydroflavonol-4-reductase